MELRPGEYQDFSRFLLAKVHFSSIDAVIHAALCIVSGFRALHNRGYSYQDLNELFCQSENRRSADLRQ